MRIFPRALDDASPTRVVRNVHHRTKRPVDATGACFPRRKCLRFFRDFGIPRCRHGNRHRENRLESVNHVVTKKEWNVQPAFLHRDVLIFVELYRINAPKKSTDLTLLNHLFTIRRIEEICRGDLVELPDLFFERHLFQ